MKLLVAVVLLIASATGSAMAQANPVEKWECKDRFEYDGWKSILVTATVNSDREHGTIAVSGATHDARFRVAGFNRRWDFGPKRDGSFLYAFVIEPNGEAAYYDFSMESRTRPSILMKCRQR
jgi:hypothetical protein